MEKFLPVIFQAINVSILGLCLLFLLKNPLKRFLENRKQTFELGWDTAQKKQESAAKHLSEMETRLKQLTTELDAIKATVREEAERARREILARAEREARSILDNARQKAEMEIAQIKQELLHTTVDQIMVITEELMKQKLASEVNCNDVAKFIIDAGDLQ
jgi:F0F1-type ATP synthase membrane subunit b/b'